MSAQELPKTAILSAGRRARVDLSRGNGQALSEGGIGAFARDSPSPGLQFLRLLQPVFLQRLLFHLLENLDHTTGGPAVGAIKGSLADV